MDIYLHTADCSTDIAGDIVGGDITADCSMGDAGGCDDECPIAGDIWKGDGEGAIKGNAWEGICLSTCICLNSTEGIRINLILNLCPYPRIRELQNTLNQCFRS